MPDATTTPAVATPAAPTIPPAVARRLAAIAAIKDETPEKPAEAAAATPVVAEPAKPAAEPRPDEKLQRAIAYEKKAQALRQELQAERTKLEEERKALDTLKQRQATYTKDPVQFLRDAFPGMDPLKALEALGNSLVAGQPAADLQVSAVGREAEEAKQAVEKLREELAEKDKKAQQEEYDRAVNDFRLEIKGYVDEHKEEFELIDMFSEHGQIFNEIEREYKDSGKELPLKEAAARVETKLAEAARKAFTAKKFIEQVKAMKNGTTPAPTLSAANPTPPGPTNRATADERRRRAIAAIPD